MDTFPTASWNAARLSPVLVFAFHVLRGPPASVTETPIHHMPGAYTKPDVLID